MAGDDGGTEEFTCEEVERKSNEGGATDTMF
jgi:hypothetical protein